MSQTCKKDVNGEVTANAGNSKEKTRGGGWAYQPKDEKAGHSDSRGNSSEKPYGLADPDAAKKTTKREARIASPPGSVNGHEPC